MRITLVADIPDEPIKGRLKDVVYCDGEFDRTQVGREVPPGAGDRMEQVVAQLRSQFFELASVEIAQVERTVNGLQQCGHYVDFPPGRPTMN